MKLYVDENLWGPVLRDHLRNATHVATGPDEAGLLGADDPDHLIHAIRTEAAFVTKDHDDFVKLHTLIMVAGGGHPGLLIVREDNDPARDMTPRGIARAVSKLEAAGVPLANEIHILNRWR